MLLVLLHRFQRESQEHHKQQRQEKTTQLQGAVSCSEDDRHLVLRLHQTLPHVSRRPPCFPAGVASDVLTITHDQITCVCRWDPAKRMTPDEGLQHEWILEGNFNKVRPRVRPAVKTDGSPSRDNSNELSFHKQTSKKPGKS